MSGKQLGLSRLSDEYQYIEIVKARTQPREADEPRSSTAVGNFGCSCLLTLDIFLLFSAFRHY